MLLKVDRVRGMLRLREFRCFGLPIVKSPVSDGMCAGFLPPR